MSEETKIVVMLSNRNFTTVVRDGEEIKVFDPNTANKVAREVYLVAQDDGTYNMLILKSDGTYSAPINSHFDDGVRVIDPISKDYFNALTE